MRMPLSARLRDQVAQYIPFFRSRQPQLDRQAVMTLRPGRNSLLSWEKQETGETILTVPENKDVGKITRWMARRLKVPTERHVELDEVGTFVWELCDGAHTVDTIVQKTGRQYKMNRREAEVSVTTFLQMLHERKFIAFYKKVGKNS